MTKPTFADLFTESERSTVTNALRVAASRYVDNALSIADEAPRIAVQFRTQQAEALALADRIESEE